MARRPGSFATLLLVFSVAVVLAAVAGLLAAPDPMVTDQRRATRITGPNGASGFASVLDTLGATVQRWDRPFFQLDSAHARAGRWLMILEPTYPFVESELRELAQWVAAGGHVFAAGETGLERCYGVRALVLSAAPSSRPRRALREASGLDVHDARAWWRPARPAGASPPDDCNGLPHGIARQAPLRTVAGDTVAMTIDLANGARVVLLADSRYVANEDLKETDAGLLIVPLVLPAGPGDDAAFLFDDFHHGYGTRGSLTRATASWMARTPLGWAMLQLAFVGLLVLAARAVRFGPALEVVHRERRSPLDHVDALATGLARARRDETTVALLVDGLRRRLGRPASAERASAARLSAWLDTLTLVTRTDSARTAVNRLKTLLTQPADKGQVLEAARTVEELWQALQPKTISPRS